MTEEARISELLKPRYKVIADWPGVAGKVIPGSIITLDDEMNVFWCGGEAYTEDKLLDYPHLFQKIEWHEERKPEEMPEYVKYTGKPCDGIKLNEVIKVVNWQIDEEGKDLYFNFPNDDTDLGRYPDNYWLPATKTEYDQYIKTKQK